MGFIQRAKWETVGGFTLNVADAVAPAPATYTSVAGSACPDQAFSALLAVKGLGNFAQQGGNAVATLGLTTLAAAFGSPNTGGGAIVVAVVGFDDGFGPVGVTCADTRGNSYTQIDSSHFLGGSLQLIVFMATGIAAGANTVTLTFANLFTPSPPFSGKLNGASMAILEYASAAGADGYALAESATGGALSVSLATTQASENLLSIAAMPYCPAFPALTGPGGPQPPAVTGNTPTPTQPFFANLAPPPLATPIVDVNAQQDNVPLPLRGVPSGDLTNAWSGWFMAVYQFLEASGLAGAAGSLGVTAVTGSTTLASPTSPQPYTGQVLALNATTAQTLTLPSMPPSGTWNVFLQNIGTGTWTISPNGLNLDGSSASITLETGQGCYLSTDGVNYFTERGRGVNLIETNGTPNAVQRLLNLESGSGVTVTDLGGGNVQIKASAGVNVQTANYAALAADSGKNIVFNDASPCTLTLPNPAPSSAWNIFVQNIGAGTLTVSRNSLTIDGAAANLTLTTGQGVYIATDGTNYFTERGMVPVVTALSAAGIAGVNYAAGAGTGNAQTAVYSPAVAALTTGLVILWTPTAANSSTTPTFAPNGLTAKTITKAGGAALAANDLTTTSIACAIYDGTSWELQNPQTTPAALSVAAIAAVNYAAGGGSANAQTATYSPAIGSLTAGLVVHWLPSSANTTTTPTFSPNGLTAKTITKAGGSALVANDLTTTAIACAIYDGTNWELQNPQTGGGGFTNPMTTKGDVIVGATSGTPARLGVGTDGQVLTAKAAATNGADWEAPLALTTTGTSGAASLTPGNPYTLNVPQYSGGGPNKVVVYTSPVLGSLTWVNQGSATASTNADNSVTIINPNSADAIKALVQAVPGSTPYSIYAAFALFSNVGNGGLIITDGTKFVTFNRNTNAPSGQFEVQRWSTSGTFSATSYGVSHMIFSPVIYLRITNDGTNLNYYVSPDAFNWQLLFSEAKGAFLGTITSYGFFADNATASYATIVQCLSLSTSAFTAS